MFNGLILISNSKEEAVAYLEKLLGTRNTTGGWVYLVCVRFIQSIYISIDLIVFSRN